MDIIVCIKRVPETAEAALIINETNRGVKEENLTFDINESDNYALEEAVLLKEKLGGTVTLVTVGPQQSDEILRMGMAKGADTAIRLTDEKFAHSDGYAIANLLAKAIRDLKYDLILTGCMATDDGYTQVGTTLAELLGIPHATLVSDVEIEDSKVKVQRELEGGLYEALEIGLPALLTIQTGINEPRYASLLSIRKAASKEIKTLNLQSLSLKEEDVGESGSKTKIEVVNYPPVGKKAELLEGTLDEVSTKLAGIFKERGLL